MGLIAFVCLNGCVPMATEARLPTRVSTAVFVTPAPPQPAADNISLPPTFTAVPPWIATPTATPAPATPIPTETPTPDPYWEWTVAHLRERPYGGGGIIQNEGLLSENPLFSRYLISYPSDGLTVYGFINVPTTPGPHPIAIVLHGYWPTNEYETVGYIAPYADALAEAGFMVVHPNYRNHPPSDNGDNHFRIGYAIDVLNLMAHVELQSGEAGLLQTAVSGEIHLFGHSMGGGIALRVLVVSDAVKTAVLYGAMSGDEQLNYAKISRWSNNEDGEVELNAPSQALQNISPIFYLNNITAHVSIHHGTNDDVVPPQWSRELCQQLQNLGRSVDCFEYAGQGHNFTSGSDQQLLERTIALFQE